MSSDEIRALLCIFQICMSLFIIVHLIRRGSHSKYSIVTVFFIYGIVCLLLSDTYWLVHGLLRSDNRIPFSVNEIGEMGTDLLFASMLGAVFKGRFAKPGLETLLTALFMLAATALWIGWTGEWVKDILSGIVFGFFACSTVRALKCSGALSKTERRLLPVLAFLLAAMQGMTFAFPGTVGKIFDILCYVLMFAVIVLLLPKTVKAVRKAFAGRDTETSLQCAALSFFSFAWTLNTMYMSSEPMYYVAWSVSTLLLPVMMFSMYTVESEGVAGK